ncbi:MAG: YkgJ family cysteine cluster protein [Spirochaetes bacterium]|nr:MAG: YkgJ family cysteine cluster protein [Spirochaetota bacterium]
MNKPFYKEGLKFECVRCSACCRFDPGYVFLSASDMDRLASFFKIDKKAIVEKYCRIVNMGGSRRLSFKEKKNFDCIFWKEGGCTIYEARPLQCRSYPFWQPFLTSEEAWNKEAENCPGMKRGKKHSLKVIENWLEKRDNEMYKLEDIL